MTKCKHENADHLMPGESSADLDNQRTIIAAVTVEQFRCLACGAWLSLGKANDGGKHATAVRIEKRAAEIAIHGRSGQGIDTWGEHDGWHATSRKPPGSARPSRNRPRQLAGYLARCIATHKDDGAGGSAMSDPTATAIETQATERDIARLTKENDALSKVYGTAACLRTFPVPFDDHVALVDAVDACHQTLHDLAEAPR